MQTLKDSLTNTNHKEWLHSLMKQGISMREQFRKDMPFLDEMPYSEQRKLWREYLELPTPLVPSAEDDTSEASCLRCRDMKWISKNKFDAIPCPDCMMDEVKQRALAYSGIPETKRQYTFDSWKPNKGSDEAFKAAYQLSMGESGFKLLLIYGDTGNGKTHLAYAAGLQAIKRGVNTRFFYVPDMFSEIRNAIQRNESDLLIDRIKHYPFLILDDIGVRTETEWQGALIEEIINHRYSNELPSIFTTNKNPQFLGPAVLSRLKDGVISKLVLNSSADYRAKKGK